MKRLAHVEHHLRNQDRVFLPYLLRPLTFEEIAQELGPGWTPRQVEHAWFWIKARMGLSEHTRDLNRLELLRITAGFDQCVCEALVADLVAEAV